MRCPYFAEMAAPEDADKAEVVQRDATGELRCAPRFVSAVAIIHRSARSSCWGENLSTKKIRQINWLLKII